MMSFKDFLYEMAFSKSKVEETISGLSLEMVKHICKVLASPKNINKTHWVKEIYNYALKSSRMKIKPKNKIPSYEQIKSWLFETSADNKQEFEPIFTGILWTENINCKYNIDDIYEQYNDIVDKLSKLISSGNIKHTDIVNIFN